jgi:hypothetical protein
VFCVFVFCLVFGRAGDRHQDIQTRSNTHA